MLKVKAQTTAATLACLVAGSATMTLATHVMTTPAQALDPVTTTAVVKAGAEAINAVLPYISGGSRSVLLEVDNNTYGNLWLVSGRHQHGGFGLLPHGRIAPRSYDVFGSKSKGLFTGTEGRVVYEGNGVNLTVYWNNPWIGSNKCNATLSGPRAANYRVFWACGAGNKNAHMRYSVYSR